MTEPGRGHRALPHTADIRLHAWAPTPQECVAEAVAALVESFAETSGVRPEWSSERELDAATPENMLVAALDEVIYVLDAEGAVPVGAEIIPGEGHCRLRLELAPVEAVSLGGAVPKAVTLSGLRIEPGDGGWSCEVTIDV